MDRILIRGGRRLDGRIVISGAKNAALPLMAAALLSDQPLRLDNAPALADIESMLGLLAQHGVVVKRPASGTLELTAGEITNTTAPYDLVRKMRASVLVLGPLLARAGRARVSLPGGCAIGTRPVDLHLMGLSALGATISLKEGYIDAEAPGGLKGARIVLPTVSVGATENLLMAASLADGESQIVNAAREPEIGDLAHCLIAMGAEIEGVGTDTLVVRGRRRLGAARHRILPDRIEAGTYAMAGAIAGGRIDLLGVASGLLPAAVELLRRAGARIEDIEGGLRIESERGGIVGVDMMTEPYPGFPTDLQAQFMALMTVARGASMITETIFENRFMHVPELTRMGADINVHRASAMVRGVPRLTGAPVMATDLRASVSLVLAGLAAEGETVISRVYHLDRGYEHLERKLAACGADVTRLRDGAAAPAGGLDELNAAE
jgi:UDP-N-acetylglucosamine 1-carboxyvinyltransferase